MNIINRFKRESYLIDYSDDGLKMFVDISSASSLIAEYPEVKNYQRFKRLTYVPRIRRILSEVIIHDAQLRQRTEDYSNSRHFHVDRDRSAHVLDHIRNNQHEYDSRSSRRIRNSNSQHLPSLQQNSYQQRRERSNSRNRTTNVNDYSSIVNEMENHDIQFLDQATFSTQMRQTQVIDQTQFSNVLFPSQEEFQQHNNQINNLNFDSILPPPTNVFINSYN